MPAPIDHGVVGRLGRPAQPAEGLFTRVAGRFRPYFSCAATNSPLAIAAAHGQLAGEHRGGGDLGELRRAAVPAQPSISRHSRAVPRPVPPPTVATVSDGSVTLA